jgi:hypothetical protein
MKTMSVELRCEKGSNVVTTTILEALVADAVSRVACKGSGLGSVGFPSVIRNITRTSGSRVELSKMFLARDRACAMLALPREEPLIEDTMTAASLGVDKGRNPDITRATVLNSTTPTIQLPS